MTYWPIVVALLVGFALGLAVALVLRIIQAKTARELAAELFDESENQRQAGMDAVVADLKASFGSLSLDALQKSTEEFLKLAKTRLDGERESVLHDLDAKKGLIDQQLVRMGTELNKVSILVQDLEKDRVQKFGELTNQLKSAGQQTTALIETTNTLREALSSTQSRGQWGERMAEDVLRLAGFIEGVNYVKQKAVEGVGTRPDFTFLLPRDLRLNMDVKFPLDNYLRFLETESDLEKSKDRNDFLRDVKGRIKEITTRDYINPQQNTLNYVLLFIPNEQVYGFIHEQDNAILDNSIRNKVIPCSPLTLFAVLAVIRQAIDNFALEQTSTEILSLLGAFKKQWENFVKKMEVLGKRISESQKEYEALMTTRRRQVERPLNKIEELRELRRIPSAPQEEEENG
ncbi:MAG: DNA recombination protein RmuC [Acidobacteriota bacterium]